jgi:hypothetical protein
MGRIAVTDSDGWHYVNIATGERHGDRGEAQERQSDPNDFARADFLIIFAAL